MLTGGMLGTKCSTMPKPFLAIPGMAGIGIQHAEREATGNTNSVIVSAMDTNLDRHVMICRSQSYSARYALTVTDVTAVGEQSHHSGIVPASVGV